MDDPLTRRRFLLVGGGVATATGLGGCLGDGDDGDGDGDDPAFAIEHVRLLSEEPADYRTYEEVADATFAADEMVWFYFEPVGVTTTDAGAGEERFELTGTLEVVDPGGEPLAATTEEFDREVAEGTTDELYLYFFYTPTTPIVPGTYTAEFEVVDELAGESVTEAVEFTIETGLGTVPEGFDVEHVRFVEDQPTGYRQYEPVPEAIYAPGDPVWIYLEPTGSATESAADGFRFELGVIADVTDPDGEETRVVDRTLSDTVADAEDLEELFVFVTLDVADQNPGEYAVDLTVTDELTDRHATRTRTFSMIPDSEDLLVAFERVLHEGTDLTVQSLRTADDILELRYTTPLTFGSDDFYAEVGYIGGVYAGFVDQGLSTARLEAVGTDADDVTFDFEVGTDVVDRWLDGEIDDESFAQVVLDTLDRRE